MNAPPKLTRPEDRARMRRRVRVITTGAVAAAAVGSVAVTLAISGTAAGTQPTGTQPAGVTDPDGSDQITAPPNAGSGSGSSDGTGGSLDQPVAPLQQPGNGGGFSHAGSGGS